MNGKKGNRFIVDMPVDPDDSQNDRMTKMGNAVQIARSLTNLRTDRGHVTPMFVDLYNNIDSNTGDISMTFERRAKLTLDIYEAMGDRAFIPDIKKDDD